MIAMHAPFFIERQADEQGNLGALPIYSSMASTFRTTGSAQGPGETSDILIVAGSHGLPATHARLQRVLELAREFSFWNLPTDVVLLREGPLVKRCQGGRPLSGQQPLCYPIENR